MATPAFVINTAPLSALFPRLLEIAEIMAWKRGVRGQGVEVTIEKYPKQRHARFPKAREYQWAWTACSQCDNLIAETVKEWLAQPRRKIVRGKEGIAVKRVDFAVQADIRENDTADTTQDETKELHNVDL